MTLRSLLRRGVGLFCWRSLVWRPNEEPEVAVLQADRAYLDAAYIRSLAGKLVLDFKQLRGCDAVLIGVESRGVGALSMHGEMIIRMYDMEWSRDLRIVFGAPGRTGGLSGRIYPDLMGLAKEDDLNQTVNVQVSSFDECWGVVCCVLTELDIRSLILQFGEDSCSPLMSNDAQCQA